MRLSDTSAGADDVYWRRLMEMTPSERTRITAELIHAADRTQRAALHHLYPNADEEEITYRIAVTRFGAGLANKIYRRQ